jgi:uncharacterized membrane protein
VTDLAFLGTTDGFFWARASIWLIGAAIVMALLGPWPVSPIFSAKPRILALSDACYHMVGNLTAVVIAVINFALRYSQGADVSMKPWRVALSLIVVGILLFTGWKGWGMVYRHRVAVLDAPEQAATDARPPGSGTRRAA